MGQAIEGRDRELLQSRNFCLVATIGADGTPHVTPTWVHIGADGMIELNTAEGRTWPANARRDPRVTLTVLNQENPYEYLSIRGRVVEDTHDGADAHIDFLAKKYLDADSYPFRAPGEVRVIFRVEPERIHRFGS